MEQQMNIEISPYFVLLMGFILGVIFFRVYLKFIGNKISKGYQKIEGNIVSVIAKGIINIINKL